MTHYYHTTERCNNCGKYGHMYKQCKLPITSYGVILFRVGHDGQREYLMIRRKDTLGYVDFMRGKYRVSDTRYILNMIKQMTVVEKQNLLKLSFEVLWKQLWNNTQHDESLAAAAAAATPAAATPKQYRSEEFGSRTKFNVLKESGTLDALVQESENTFPPWEEPEWGFPKGRRNYNEKDYECAIREMSEETGYPIQCMKNIKNILPYEEIFIGSNYKSYKHKYYLMYMKYEDTLNPSFQYDPSEVSAMEWKPFTQCLRDIRPYNQEKKQMLRNIETMLTMFVLELD